MRIFIFDQLPKKYEINLKMIESNQSKNYKFCCMMAEKYQEHLRNGFEQFKML